jgi:hypothetical protein
LLWNQKFNERWSQQLGADVQVFREPNQIQLASTAAGVVFIVQPGLGLVLSGPLTGSGNATTTAGGDDTSGALHDPGAAVPPQWEQEVLGFMRRMSPAQRQAILSLLVTTAAPIAYGAKSGKTGP